MLLRCRESDLALVQAAGPKAAAAYAAKTGLAAPTVDVDASKFLPAAPEW